MKSKSFDLAQSSATMNQNSSFQFSSLYENISLSSLETKKSSDGSKRSDVSKRNERTPNKHKKRLLKPEIDVTRISIDGSSININAHNNSSVNIPTLTSTPNSGRKNQDGVKSIMKNYRGSDDPTETIKQEATSKPKKRNKSVSFMLDDTEEVAIKKTKSDDSLKIEKNYKKLKNKGKDVKIKKIKKNRHGEKENNIGDTVDQISEDNSNAVVEKKSKIKGDRKKNLLGEAKEDLPIDSEHRNESHCKNLKSKRNKTKKSHLDTEPSEKECSNEEQVEIKTKKVKKKKHHKKGSLETEEEPAAKSRKKEAKPDIAEDLENLSIGENAHTLTNLLDDMKVVDKDKQRKGKSKKEKRHTSTESSEKSEEVKEKVKWKKRKWNKDKKGDVDEEKLATSIIVENLPLSIMLNYKKLLAEEFEKFGLIKQIGVAEVYPTEESKPVFTTSINFYSDGAATQALEKNNNLFQGNKIRVKRPLPPTETTVVVRSYAELNEQAVTSLFTGAGRIRNIRHLVKGKKTMSAVFVEMDGPETVERAIKMATGAKIGGKKAHVSRFEVRKKKEKKPKTDGESENEGDTEDSVD